MFNYLERLRRKPIEARKRIALGAAAGLTLAIVLVWLSSILYSPASKETADANGPVKAIGETIGTFLTDTFRAFKDMRKEFSFDDDANATSSVASPKAAR